MDKVDFILRRNEVPAKGIVAVREDFEPFLFFCSAQVSHSTTGNRNGLKVFNKQLSQLNFMRMVSVFNRGEIVGIIKADRYRPSFSQSIQVSMRNSLK